MSYKSKNVALFFAKLLHEKKAQDIVILDIQKISFIADYFIIATGSSSTHLKTLANTVIEKIKENNINRNVNYEGSPVTGWVLLDCNDIVIHLFSEEKRDYYNLEYIWQEAHRVSMPEIES